MALSRPAALVAVLCLVATTSIAEMPQSAGDLSAVREGLKAQSALASEDESKMAKLLEEIRASDARLLQAARAQESLGDGEKRLEKSTRVPRELRALRKERAAAASVLEARLADIYKRGRSVDRAKC